MMQLKALKNCKTNKTRYLRSVSVIPKYVITKLIFHFSASRLLIAILSPTNQSILCCTVTISFSKKD